MKQGLYLTGGRREHVLAVSWRFREYGWVSVLTESRRGIIGIFITLYSWSES